MATPELEALAYDFARERSNTFSRWAAYYGLAEYYPRLTYPSKDQLDSYRSRLKDLLSLIDALPEDPDEVDAIDREVLRFAVDYERFTCGQPPYEESTVSPANIILQGMHDILRLSRLSNDERLALVLARLEQSLSLFDTLQQTWQVPAALDLENTISQARDIDQTLQAMLRPLLDAFPRQKLAIEHLVTAIGEAGRAFAHRLHDKAGPGVDRACYVMGQDDYDRLLHVRQEGHTWPERLALGEQSLLKSRKRLGRLAPHLAPDDGTMEAALKTVRENLPEIPILEEARNAYRRVAAFLNDRQLLFVPEARYQIEEPPTWDPFWGEGMVGITYAEILREDPQFTIVVVPPTTEQSRRELNRSDILLAMAHEGVAGHLGSLLLQKQRNSIVRLLLPLGMGIDDRWTFYWEQLLREEGIDPGPEYEFLQEYRVFWCSLRHICDVKLHCGLMSFEECVEFLTREGRVSPLTARAYTKAIARMPGYFSSFVVGKQQLIGLREWARAHLGARYSSALFHQWVGQAGPVPYHLLEREIRARAGVE